MRSQGQAWAFDQLKELVRASGGAFELLDTTEPDQPGRDLVIVVAIDCSGFEHRDDGLRFKARERLRLIIPAKFPLSLPRVYFTHKRHAGYPHVQWGDYVCLYQAPDVEWDASRGMFGLMQRIDEWLRAAASGDLDPVGMPLHPPVAYDVGRAFVVPTKDAPELTPPFWSGYVEITREDEIVTELGSWIEDTEQVPDTRLASVILLPGSMPHEYPSTMADLLLALDARGVGMRLLRLTMTVGVLRTQPGQRAFFVLGSAMRGIAGEQRLQHLACWRIDAERTTMLRDAAIAATEDNPVDQETFYRWAFEAKVEWCRVLEDRPEIVERRDSRSPASWWRGKSVALLGCGAIGSALGMMLARAGVARLHLCDKGIVTPGVLVRQGFPRNHVGYSKVSSLKVAVGAANPSVDVTTDLETIVTAFDDDARLAAILTADVIIDATASPSVSAALEAHFRSRRKAHPPVVSMVVGHDCDAGMMTLAVENAAGMGLDLDRRMKLALANSSRGRRLLEEFWPVNPERRALFQPEPGCSSPTFRGSYADVLGLVARMTNVASSWLAKGGDVPRAFAMDLSGGPSSPSARELEFSWTPAHVMREGRQDYEVRLSDDALKGILTWVRRVDRIHGDRTETGGILFGQVDDFLKIVWIDEVSGPPPDSVASPAGFLCGTAGVASMHDEKVARSSGSVAFLGMWHTHPEALPIPSRTDRQAMRELMRDGSSYGGRSFFMLIVGGTPARPILSAGLYERSDDGGA